jgi:hypothetical protein
MTKFTMMATGKLALAANQIGASETKQTAFECAKKCVNIPTCQSFTFDANGHSCVVNNMVYAKASATATNGASTVEWFDGIDV